MTITYITNTGKKKPVEYINTIGKYARVRWGTGQISSVPVDRCTGIPSGNPIKLEQSGNTIWLNVTGVPDELNRVISLLETADDYTIESDKIQVLAGYKLMILTCSEPVITALEHRENMAREQYRAEVARQMKEPARGPLDMDRRTREYKLIRAGRRGELCGCEQIAYEDYLKNGWIDWSMYAGRAKNGERKR
jgi:hypothetical protein